MSSGPRRNPDFLKLWAAQGISAFGARITREGLPITAVLALGSSPEQLGVLAALSSGPALVVGLAAGGFVDRTKRRGVLISADLVRAAILVTVPLAAWLGVLSVGQLYLAAALVGAASVLFDIADHAYLPGLLEREHLTEGNARLSVTESVAELAGPALAGVLFQWLTAPFAVAVNAATYVASAAFLGTIRKPEPVPEPQPAASWTRDVVQGVRAAWDERRVRPLLLMATSNGLFGSIFGALYILFALRTLHLTPSMLGLTIACGGIGAFAGAGLAPWLSRRLGVGPAILVASAGAGLATLAIPLAPANPVGGMAALISAQLVGDALAVAGAVLAASLRQTVLPQSVLGRVGATFHAASGGAAVVGALAGGALGGLLGAREALWVAALGLLVAPVMGLVSPLPRVREMPVVPAEPLK